MRSGFKRGLAGIVLAGVTLLAASACATAPGTDGNLVNEWPAHSAPLGWEPKAETCHKDFAATSFRRAYAPVSCTEEHRYETAYVGQFTGDAAKLPAPPKAGSVEMGAAWKECDTKTTAFLGGQWRSGRTWILVSLPAPGAWEGGARWFRCDVTIRQEPTANPAPWSQSLKGEFARDSQLKFGCYQIPENEDEDWVPTACTAGHNAEFVGVAEINETWEALNTDAVAEKIHTKCRSAIASYVGVPDNADMKYRTGTYYSYPSRDDWQAGNQTVRCHLWKGDKTLTKSLKGTGNAGLPVD